MHRSRTAGQGLAEGGADQFGDAARLMHHGAPFDDRLKQGAIVHFHEHAAAGIAGHLLIVGGDGQHRQIIVEGMRHAGRQIDRARPGFGHGHGDAVGAGMDGGGHQPGMGLVADADIAHRVAAGHRLHEGRQLAAAHAEHEGNRLGQ